MSIKTGQLFLYQSVYLFHYNLLVTLTVIFLQGMPNKKRTYLQIRDKPQLKTKSPSYKFPDLFLETAQMFL